MPPIIEWMGLGGGIYSGDKTMGNFELNQIMAFQFRSPAVAIGSQIEFNDSLFEIFDPELALIGKLEKIPIMRSLRIDINHVPDVYIAVVGDTGIYFVKKCVPGPPIDCFALPGGWGHWEMVPHGTGNVGYKWLIQLFNDSQYNNPENPGGTVTWNGKKPNLLGVASRHVLYIATVGDVDMSIVDTNFLMHFAGGIPLKPRMMIRNELGMPGVVAGRNIAIGELGHGTIYMEVDWKKVSKAEFQDYIMEYIYTQES